MPLSDDSPTKFEAQELPLFHEAVLERIVALFLRSVHVPDVKLSHVELGGPAGSGKSFMVDRVAERLRSMDFSGKVVMLPRYNRHIQCASDFINFVASELGDGDGLSGADWESTFGKISRSFSKRNKKNKALVLIVEDYPAVFRRVFSTPTERERFRTFLTSGSVVLLATFRPGDELDDEFRKEFFDGANRHNLDPIEVIIAQKYLPPGRDHNGDLTAVGLFDFLFRIGDRTPRALNSLIKAHRSARGPASASIIKGELAWRADASDFLFSGLGQRATFWLHLLVGGGEPATQSFLAEKAGMPQSMTAQPFAEMRRKGLLREEVGLNGKSKLVSLADRYLAAIYRFNALPWIQSSDPVFVLADLLERGPAPVASINAMDIISMCKVRGPEAAYQVYLKPAMTMPKDAYHLRSLAMCLIGKVTSKELLEYIGDAMLKRDGLAAEMVKEFISAHFVETARDSWVTVQPDFRYFFEALLESRKVREAAHFT